ncbi:MAG: hypothetical protein PHE17_06695 [Thiothrix sp.]|uniref:hypothetical protein n=1 Tax=Thiothrix sp. TaxID=1032 RepID=UPI0026330067|nr:hypothetical protein [Thiothrix sp.]MDD5392691.1 hypothetical protein [Thiothrix sp.]
MQANEASVFPVTLKVDGTCAQLLGSLEGKATDAPGTFLLYRALIDGRTTRYNQALLASNHAEMLTPKDASNTFMIKQAVARCADSKHKNDYAALVSEVLAQRLASVYPREKIGIKLSDTLKPQYRERVLQDAAVVGIGRNKCGTVVQRTRSRLGEAVYKAWLGAYLMPSQQNKHSASADTAAFYQRSLDVCRAKPDISFAAAVLEVR